METIYPNQIAEMPQHKGLKFQSLIVFINVNLTFVNKEHKNSYVFAYESTYSKDFWYLVPNIGDEPIKWDMNLKA